MVFSWLSRCSLVSPVCTMGATKSPLPHQVPRAGSVGGMRSHPPASSFPRRHNITAIIIPQSSRLWGSVSFSRQVWSALWSSPLTRPELWKLRLERTFKTRTQIKQQQMKSSLRTQPLCSRLKQGHFPDILGRSGGSHGPVSGHLRARMCLPSWFSDCSFLLRCELSVLPSN